MARGAGEARTFASVQFEVVQYGPGGCAAFIPGDDDARELYGDEWRGELDAAAFPPGSRVVVFLVPPEPPDREQQERGGVVRGIGR